jgi:hypothetical protein
VFMLKSVHTSCQRRTSVFLRNTFQGNLEKLVENANIDQSKVRYRRTLTQYQARNGLGRLLPRDGGKPVFARRGPSPPQPVVLPRCATDGLITSALASSVNGNDIRFPLAA